MTQCGHLMKTRFRPGDRHVPLPIGRIEGARRFIVVSGPFGVEEGCQSSGSAFTKGWAWLLPVQNVTGAVELSMNTVRILVSLGIRYCTLAPIFGSMRTTRSFDMPPVQMSPFLSNCAR